MSNTENPSPAKSKETGNPTPTAPPAVGDVESHVSGEPLAAVSSRISKWGRQDKMEKGSLSMRGVGLVFSFLAFIVMATNDHGGWKRFQKYPDYRYVLAVAIVSFLYTGGQVFRQIHEIFTGKETFNRRNLALFNFIGDQICAYLLISAASSGVPATRTFTEYIEKGYVVDSIFRDSSAAAISMEFLAFVSLALSAVISGNKLSRLCLMSRKIIKPNYVFLRQLFLYHY